MASEMTDADLIHKSRRIAAAYGSDGVARDTINELATALEERGAQLERALTDRTVGMGGQMLDIHQVLARALAAEQERDRWKSNENLQMERAIRAESSLARLQAERDSLADEVERLALIVDRWESENRAKKDARTAPAQEG